MQEAFPRRMSDKDAGKSRCRLRKCYNSSKLPAHAAASTMLLIANAPVPASGGRPTTMRDEGLIMLSKSPCRAASAMKAEVVSYDAFVRGDALLPRPVRLNGL